MKAVIVDTGAIVALLSKNDQWRTRALDIFETLDATLLTCESAIPECCFLLRNTHNGERIVLDLISSNALTIDFSISEHIDNIAALMQKYRSVPMSLADACLVRMSEVLDAPIFTFDRDFEVYRRHGRKRIPLIGIGD